MAIQSAQEEADLADERAGAAFKPTAVPNRRAGFVQIANAFILDPSVPNDAKLLLMVFYAEAKGTGMVRLSQREIRDRTNMPPERQDAALDWILERDLIDVVSKKGAKPAFVLRPSLLLDWTPDPSCPRAQETRKPRAPVGKARQMMLDRLEREGATPLLDLPSATSGKSGETDASQPSAINGSSPKNHPRTTEANPPNLPLAPETPSAGSGQSTQPKKINTNSLNTSSISRDDASLHRSLDDLCEMLRAARVNIYPHEVGINRTTGKRLTSANLLEWLDALARLTGLANPAGYVAKAIRLGSTFADDQSLAAQRARDRSSVQARRESEEHTAHERARIEQERNAQLDSQIDALPRGERGKLERLALHNPTVWNARDTSPEIFERVLRSCMRKIHNGELSATGGSYDYSRSRNARRAQAILGDGEA